MIKYVKMNMNQVSMKYSKLSEKWYLFREKTASAFRALFAWRHSWIFLAINLLFVTVLFAGAWQIFSNFKEEIFVLHYNIDFGVDWVGDKSLIFWPAGIGGGMLIIDFLVLLFVSKRQDYKFLSWFLWSGLTICEMFLLASLFADYLFNFH